LWTIPLERMKGDVGHEVPLSPMAIELLEALPSFKGDFIFTTTSGKRPISGFSKAKARLDESIAGLREEDANGAEVAPMPRWTFHDLRRTVRTRPWARRTSSASYPGASPPGASRDLRPAQVPRREAKRS
jgi:integrase